ncbi:STAS domain-containing protein [Actinomadura sp. LOL_016]|uniref:STAS domain-containing protein n=1 Tax=unclassified Actinomadura TaxID=2626254 RepID=UPI003A7FA0FA
MLVKPTAPQPSSPEVEPTSADATADRTGARPGRDLTLRTSRQGSLSVLHMDGTLNAETAVTAEAKMLSTIVLTAAPLHLVLDLTGLTRIDSAGISLLAKARFTVHAARGTLHIVAPSGSPARLALQAGVPRSAHERVESIADIRLEAGAPAPGEGHARATPEASG